jgi:glucosyl-3-phosphoglycerate synthase
VPADRIRRLAPSTTDLATLAGHKRAQGTTVSVVIPARNEAARVGGVVRSIRTALQQQVALVDELLVVDADSTDDTAEVARRAGARVVRQRDVLPTHGTGPGKGEAMWKGLAATTGELVAFVDADLVDVDPLLVARLIEPLLRDADTILVKAAYDRPLMLDGHHDPQGGGRVTELLVRPLLASLWPPLAWLAQPLGGEYAARREVLEKLPFVRGYGVELGLLLDIHDRYGAARIVEVDVGRREHEHQSLAALGRMAAEILQVALRRADREGIMELTVEPGRRLPQPRRSERGILQREVAQIAFEERPPLRSIPPDTPPRETPGTPRPTTDPEEHDVDPRGANGAVE